MAKNKRIYSSYTLEAIALLGKLIRQKRIEKKFTAKELAERANISRDLLYRVEKGEARCEIGVYFELANLVNISLFNVADQDKTLLTTLSDAVNQKLSLLPKSVHQSVKVVDDDF
ncbi:MAG: helix-turn-helix transcriptional regulator [Gammaproteobacteria bacterium]|nr:helix-turn-helix transcriptional regulator [Gammaproteobacteria bacterium]